MWPEWCALPGPRSRLSLSLIYSDHWYGTDVSLKLDVDYIEHLLFCDTFKMRKARKTKQNCIIIKYVFIYLYLYEYLDLINIM